MLQRQLLHPSPKTRGHAPLLMTSPPSPLSTVERGRRLPPKPNEAGEPPARPTVRTIDKIIIHCTATPVGREVTVDEVRRWHRERGFADIGYHYLIHLDGRVSPGRPLRQMGAHCTNHNMHSIGIAYVGGLARDCRTSMDTRTPAQRKALRGLVGQLLRDYPGATVHGHREFAVKDCPCFDVQQWIKDEMP